MKSWRAVLALACLASVQGLSVELEGGGRIDPVSAGELAEVLEAHEGKVVLVNFWATWCAPCLREIPALLELADDYAEEGLVLVPVSLDDPGDIEATVVPFLNKWFPEFVSFARTDYDMDTVVSVVDPYWNEILPTSYLIGRDGEVAEPLQGGKEYAEFEALVRPLL